MKMKIEPVIIKVYGFMVITSLTVFSCYDILEQKVINQHSIMKEAVTFPGQTIHFHTNILKKVN